MRRRIVPFLGLALLLGFGRLASPQPALALQFVGACSQGHDNYNFSLFADRGVDFGGTGSDYNGAYAEVTAEYIQACTPAANIVGTAIPAANVQKTTGTCANLTPPTACIVQVGFMECSAPAPYNCNGVPADSKVHFFYNCHDNSSLPCLADGWFGSAPILGHRYAFEITVVNSSWTYMIRDVAVGTWKTATLAAMHWSAGTGVWWGGENHNEWSMLGPGSTAPDVFLSSMEYHRPSTSWVVISPSIHKTGVNEDTGGSVAWPTWYQGTLAEWTNPNDSINLWTNAH